MSVRENCKNLGRANKKYDRKSARVAAKNESDWAVWVKAYSIKALNADDSMRNGFMYYEEVLHNGTASGRAGVEDDSVDQLQEA